MSIHRTNIFNDDKKIIYRKKNTHRYYIRVRTTTKCCEHVLDKILTRLTESSNIRFVLTNRQKTRRQDFFYNNSYTLHKINNTMKFVVYNTAVFFFFYYSKKMHKNRLLFDIMMVFFFHFSVLFCSFITVMFAKRLKI